jgi:hypothetical protein
MRIGQFSGQWPMTPIWGAKDVGKPGTAQVNGVASNGRAVGWRRSGTTLAYTNYVVDSTGSTATAVWNFNGLNGTAAGQALSVSADGTVIFGMSPKTGAPSTNNYGYRAVFNASMPGPATQLSISQLPGFPDTAGSANLAIPYGCTADGKHAVGMSYRGVEKAVLWDTSDTNSAKWTAVDLTDVAAVNGVLNGFTRLSRGYGVGTNAAEALVIAGVGLDTNSPANTRAFVMTLAPSSASLVARPTVTIAGSYPAGFTFSFPTIADGSLRYYLEYATNLTGAIAWSTLTSTPGTGAIASLPDSNPSGSQRFYRIRVQ